MADQETNSVLDKLNREVLPGLSQLRIDIEVIKAQLFESAATRDKERTMMIDAINRHDRILRGNNGNPGLISKVDKVGEWIQARIWVERGIVIAIAVDIALRLASLLTN